MSIQGTKDVPRARTGSTRSQTTNASLVVLACTSTKRIAPQKDKTCKHCKKKGHMSHLCYSLKEKSAALNDKKEGKKFGRITKIARVGSISPSISVQVTDPVNKRSLSWQEAIADTGAEACVAGVDLLKKLGVSRKKLQPAKHEIFAFYGTPETCLGFLKVVLENEYYNTEGR